MKLLLILMLMVSNVFSYEYTYTNTLLEDELPDLMHIPRPGEIKASFDMEYQKREVNLSYPNLSILDATSTVLVQTSELVVGLTKRLVAGISISQVMQGKTGYSGNGVEDREGTTSSGIQDPFIFTKIRILGMRGLSPKGDVVFMMSPEMGDAEYDNSADAPKQSGAGRGGSILSAGLELGNKTEDFELSVNLLYHQLGPQSSQDISDTGAANLGETQTHSRTQYEISIFGQYPFERVKAHMSLGAKFVVHNRYSQGVWANAEETSKVWIDSYATVEVPLEYKMSFIENSWIVSVGVSYWSSTETTYNDIEGNTLTYQNPGDGYSWLAGMSFAI